MILKIYNDNNSSWSYYDNIKSIQLNNRYGFNWESYQNPSVLKITCFLIFKNKPGLNTNAIYIPDEIVFDYYKYWDNAENNKDNYWGVQIIHIEYNDNSKLTIGKRSNEAFILNDSGKTIERI
jgi:hypothetical protein